MENSRLTIRKFSIAYRYEWCNKALCSPAPDVNRPSVPRTLELPTTRPLVTLHSLAVLVMRKRNIDHIHITFIIAYCYNYSILLVGVNVDLLLS